MEGFEFFRPSEPLRPYVRFYWRFRSLRPHCVLTFPVGCPMLIFHLGTPFRVPELDRRQDRATVSGQVDFPSHICSDGAADTIAVVFRPWGLGRFLDVPLSSLRNLEVSGYDLEDRGLGDLATRLLASDDATEGIAAVERWLLARLAARRPADRALDRVRGAVGTLLASPWTPVASLAAQACLSTKQFERLFAAGVGIAPKSYAGIVRFHLSLRAMERSCGPVDYARVACDCGYADQSHFIREFRRFAGCTPAVLAKRGPLRSDLLFDPF